MASMNVERHLTRVFKTLAGLAGRSELLEIRFQVEELFLKLSVRRFQMSRRADS